jgi:hypothetical protein
MFAIVCHVLPTSTNLEIEHRSMRLKAFAAETVQSSKFSAAHTGSELDHLPPPTLARSSDVPRPRSTRHATGRRGESPPDTRRVVRVDQIRAEA